MCHRSIFFNLFQVKTIIKTLNQLKDKIFISPKAKELEIILEKLNYKINEDSLLNLLKIEKKHNLNADSLSQQSKKKIKS